MVPLVHAVLKRETGTGSGGITARDFYSPVRGLTPRTSSARYHTVINPSDGTSCRFLLPNTGGGGHSPQHPLPQEAAARRRYDGVALLSPFGDKRVYLFVGANDPRRLCVSVRKPGDQSNAGNVCVRSERPVCLRKGLQQVS